MKTDGPNGAIQQNLQFFIKKIFEQRSLENSKNEIFCLFRFREILKNKNKIEFDFSEKKNREFQNFRNSQKTTY